MRKTIIALISVLLLQNLSAMEHPGDLPSDSVLALKDQMNLFTKAYESFDPANIDIKKTHFPGLVPMVRMQYSYVNSLVKDSPAHLDLLNQFWRKTKEAISYEHLTIARMKTLNVQLALLLLDYQKGKFRNDISPSYQRLYQDGQSWKDINNYNENDVFRGFSSLLYNAHVSSPFLFEAILCNPKGFIPYGLYVDAYIGYPFVMHLSALSHEGEGAHGGSLKGSPPDFLEHDFGHGTSFCYDIVNWQEELTKNPPTSHLIFWDTLRSLLRTIRAEKLAPALNNRGCFYLIHEAIPSLIDEESIPDLNLPEEEVNIPLSRRKLFLCAVAYGAGYTKTKDYVSEAFRGYLHNLSCQLNEIGLSANALKAHPKGDGNYTATVMVNMVTPMTEISEQELTSTSPNKVGSFSVDFTILPTQDPFQETIKVLKIEDPFWDETVQTHLFLNNQKIIAENINNWVSQFQQSPSRLWNYCNRTKDNEKMLRSLYKDDHGLPPVDASLLELDTAVGAGMTRFWREFYLTNKDLFSATEL